MFHQVIVHEEMGVYLGSCLGLGFWTKLDPVDQTAAVVFPSPEAAIEHIQQADDPSIFDGITTVRVVPDEFDCGGAFISFGALRAQGLGAYLPVLH